MLDFFVRGGNIIILDIVKWWCLRWIWIKIVVILLVIFLILATSSYAATNYVINASKVAYSDNSNYKVNGVHSHWYQVGSLIIVNISLAITTPSTATTVEVIKDLPKPKYNMNYIFFGAEQPTTSPPVGVLSTNGILRIMGGTAGHLFDGQLVYTVEW